MFLPLQAQWVERKGLLSFEISFQKVVAIVVVFAFEVVVVSGAVSLLNLPRHSESRSGRI